MEKMTITKDVNTNMLSLTDLNTEYLKFIKENNICIGYIQNIQTYLNNQYIIDRIYAIHKSKLDEVCNDFYSNVQNIGLLDILKKANLYKTTGARHTKSTFCEEQIFLLLFSSLHPRFYAHFVIYITSKLLGKHSNYPVNIIEKNISFNENIMAVPDILDVTYFIKDTMSNEIKIGKAKNLLKRFASLSISNRHLKFIGYKKGDFEKEMHIKYKKYRVCGEWFAFPDNIEKEIIENEIISHLFYENI